MPTFIKITVVLCLLSSLFIHKKYCVASCDSFLYEICYMSCSDACAQFVRIKHDKYYAVLRVTLFLKYDYDSFGAMLIVPTCVE